MTRKEVPILFSPGLVTKIAEGKKTTTRRIASTRLDDPETPVRAPCKAGDVLWVRERFRSWLADDPHVEGYSPIEFVEHYAPIPGPRTLYRRRAGELALVSPGGAPPPGTTWRPSIHMPRWASRIRLEVLEVRREHLQEITLAEILAEGVEPATSEAWIRLWDSINGKRPGCSWAENPEVWAIDFKVIGSNPT